MFPGVFFQAKEKKEAEKRRTYRIILMVIHSDKFSDKVPGSSMEKIFHRRVKCSRIFKRR